MKMTGIQHRESSASPIMMQLGEFQFGLDTAAYQTLYRSSSWRWVELARPGNTSILQYGGRDSERISLPGVIYPEWRGGSQQVDAMRQQAERGQPLLMVDGRGRVMGDWVIERIEERQSAFGGRGTPRRIEFDLLLRRFHSGNEEVVLAKRLRMKQPGVRTQAGVGGFATRGARMDSRPLASDSAGSASEMLRSEKSGASLQAGFETRQMNYLRRVLRQGRDGWRDVRKTGREGFEAWDRQFRKDLFHYQEGVDAVFRSITGDKPAGPILANAAGLLTRVSEVNGKLLRQSGKIEAIMKDQAFGKLMDKAGVRRERLERVRQRLQRVNTDVARARMLAESASARLQKDAQLFDKDPFTLRKLMDSELLAVLVEAGAVSNKTVEQGRKLHDKISALVREVAEEIRRERESAEKGAEEDGGRSGVVTEGRAASGAATVREVRENDRMSGHSGVDQGEYA